MVRSILSKFAFALLSLLLSSAAFAQHTFTAGVLNYYSGCAEMTTLDGQPANQATGFGGEVCVQYNENPWWGLETPQVWGFPNNGFLLNNTTTPSLSAPVFLKPGCSLSNNLSNNGCIDYETAAVSFNGYGAGVSLDVTVFFQVACKVGRYGRVFCVNNQTSVSGATSYTP